jgi:phosphate uptake regulator
MMKAELDHRDVRKVQFTGRSTYVLSLPKRWIEEMHLKAGDRVTLIRELDNSLSILPIFNGVKESPNEATALVSPNESGSTLRRKVISMYLAGFNIIHLKLKSAGLTLHSVMRLENWLDTTLLVLR